MSGARDKTIRLWNTLGECKYTIGEPEGHSEWVACVRFSPITTNPIIVSGGWDKAVSGGGMWCGEGGRGLEGVGRGGSGMREMYDIQRHGWGWAENLGLD